MAISLLPRAVSACWRRPKQLLGFSTWEFSSPGSLPYILLPNKMPAKSDRIFRFIAAAMLTFLLSSCATSQRVTRSESPAVTNALREARSPIVPPEKRAADYLQAAALAAPQLGSGTRSTDARETYNAAAAELTVLLRSADGGRLWNQSLTLTAQNRTYHLRLQPGSPPSVWAPDYFTSFEEAAKVRRALIKKDVVQ